jgi:hypothetical protein
MLKAGGSKHHKELLAPFGLDASDPAFWDKGLGMISGFIDELEAMEGRVSHLPFGERRLARLVADLLRGRFGQSTISGRSTTPSSWVSRPQTRAR